MRVSSLRRKGLSVHDGCIFWGTRVVMQELHEGLPDICCMKSLARMFLWWPGLDKDCKEFVRLCHSC